MTLVMHILENSMPILIRSVAQKLQLSEKVVEQCVQELWDAGEAYDKEEVIEKALKQV
jgi:predicted transcriptional regulator